jgi:wyosine [tRNA(Phe)-imidazoG37] synthetase (radical SAM superfamily)
MLVKDCNDTAKELSSMRNVIFEIQPDRVYLNTVVRPPSEMNAKPLSRKEMTAVKKFLDEDCEIIADFHGQTRGESHNVQDTIIEMAKRRPLRIVDVANVLGISEENAGHMIRELKAKNRIKEKLYHGEKYYSYTTAK